MLDQILPSIFAFILLCSLYTGAAYLLSHVVSPIKPHRDTYAFAVSMGNYMFLGWGVVHSFYGEAAFTRAVFFVDHSEIDKELLAGIITFSTLISLATIPLWYMVIEKFFSLP